MRLTVANGHTTHPRAGLVLAAAAALAAASCSRCGGASGKDPVVGRYQGGVVTASDLQKEASRLPPVLRQQFETEAGRREFVSAMIDKRLLAVEGRRRGLTDEPEIRRQVGELEERLVIQALVSAEEKSAGSPAEAELRAYYDAHKEELAQPERVRVSRVVAAAGAQPSERARARARAEALARRLRAGEPMAWVAAQGDGPEKARGGDMGFLIRGAVKDARLESAAFGLRERGSASPVFECDEGFAVLVLEEHRERRVPTFDEARGEVANRMEPQRKRRVFEALLVRLRAENQTQVELAAKGSH